MNALAQVRSDVRGLRRYGRAGLGAFADSAVPPQLQQQYNDVMDNVIGMLRRAVTSVRSRIALEQSAETLSSLLGPLGLAVQAFTSSSEAKAAVLSGLATMDNIIARLDVPSRAEVLLGTETPDQWMRGAAPVSDGIQSIAQTLKDDTTANLVAAQMDQAAQQFKDLGAAISSGLGGLGMGTIALIGGAVILAVVLLPTIIRLTPMGRVARRLSAWDPEQRDLEGYGNRRRKHKKHKRKFHFRRNR